MQEKTKFEKIFTIASIATAFSAIGLLVLAFMQVLPINRFILDLLLILAIIGFGCVSSISALRMLMINKKNIFAYVILGMAGLVTILWVVFVFVGRGLVDSLANYSANMGSLSNVWGYTRTVILLTVQCSIANMVLTNIYNFKKNFLPFQIIMYVSNLIVDLWLTIVLLSLSISTEGFVFTANWLLDSTFIATLFVLAMVFTWVSGGVLRNLNNRRLREEFVDSLVATKVINNNIDNILQPEETKEETQQEQPAEVVVENGENNNEEK